MNRAGANYYKQSLIVATHDVGDFGASCLDQRGYGFRNGEARDNRIGRNKAIDTFDSDVVDSRHVCEGHGGSLVMAERPVLPR